MSDLHRAVHAYQSFAESYDRGRPDYPNEAVDALATRLEISAGSVVLDLAAGTGKLTRVIIPRAGEVVAVEPIPAFRAILARYPCEVVAGTAQEIPQPDNRFDATVIGQAYHWFAGEAALRELERVLKPGGALGMIWNNRPPSHPAHRAINELLAPYRDRAPSYVTGAWRDSFEDQDRFAPLRHSTHSWTRTVDGDTFLDRFASVSVVAELEPEGRADLLERLAQVFAAHADSDGLLRVPYVTDVFSTTALAHAKNPE